jgi:hypothetical protein
MDQPTDAALDEETYDFNEWLAFVRDHEDMLKVEDALPMEAIVDWEAVTLEEISPDERYGLLQTFAVDWELYEEASVGIQQGGEKAHIN